MIIMALHLQSKIWIFKSSPWTHNMKATAGLFARWMELQYCVSAISAKTPHPYEISSKQNHWTERDSNHAVWESTNKCPNFTSSSGSKQRHGNFIGTQQSTLLTFSLPLPLWDSLYVLLYHNIRIFPLGAIKDNIYVTEVWNLQNLHTQTTEAISAFIFGDVTAESGQKSSTEWISYT